MTNIELINKIEALKEWKALIEEANNQVKSLEEEIKDELINKEVDEYEVGKYVVRYTTVISNKFDTTRFKKELPETYKAYLKPSTSHRFSIN